ncbi:helix-turn-helix domain-containing protein [Corynebacterium macclintockiae]|uniref:helix-turn-helix domain-containing protein n=1 Tax=Corynebacterium macclintockiae TaxID=2913501 RepID=UPI003EBC4B78
MSTPHGHGHQSAARAEPLPKRQGGAEKSGVASSTISDILNGNSWPTLKTVARLEVGLGVRLWPGVKTTRGNT